MLTQRLGSATQKNSIFIDKLLQTIKKNPGSCDEVWFASDYGFPAISVHEKTAEIIGEQAQKFREAGIRISLQISNTIGHGEYMKSQDCSGLVYDGSPVEHLVGYDGKVANYCFCWNGEHFREYIMNELRIYAKIHPHTVWFDDDLRPVNHNPVNFGCFCNHCIVKFNRKYGTSFDRNGLVNAINYGEEKYREYFVAFARENLYDFAYRMAKTVHEISPETYMGYQYYCNGGFTGFNFDYIFDGLRDGSGKAPKSRPGGGCYDAHNPNDIVGKMLDIDFQNSMLPPYVTEIRPEIENLPDVVYGKSIASTCLETGLNLARGADAMSYAMIMNDYESFDWHNDMFAAFALHRRYWEKLSEISKQTTAGGVPFYYSKNMWRKKLSADEEPFSYEREPVRHHGFLQTTGIPITLIQNEGVCFLSGEVTRMLSDDDITALLHRNILTDGLSVQIINERGFGAQLGVTAERFESRAFRIEYKNHPANTVCPGKKWKKSICDSTYDYRLRPQNANVSVLSFYNTEARDVSRTDGEYPFGISEVLTQTVYGATWAVLGYDPWTNIICTDRRNYLISVLDYLGDSVSAFSESRIQASVMPRMKNGKVFAVSVLNCEVGQSGEIVLQIRKPYGNTPVFINEYGEYLPKFTVKNDSMSVTIENINAWNLGTVFFGGHE